MNEVAYNYTRWRVFLPLLLGLVILATGMYWALAIWSDFVQAPDTSRKILLVPVIIMLGLYITVDYGRRFISRKPALEVTFEGIQGPLLGRVRSVAWRSIRSIKVSDPSGLHKTIDIALEGGQTIKLGKQYFSPSVFEDIYENLSASLREKSAGAS